MRMKCSGLVLAGLTIASPTSAQQGKPLDWLTGNWCTERVSGERICERWGAMDGGVMEGVTETIAGSGSTLETMRITSVDGWLVFHAEPKGQAPADFRSTKAGDRLDAVTFENAAHDYPQRIRLWREGALLMAEISQVDGSKSMRWRYHRVNE